MFFKTNIKIFFIAMPQSHYLETGRSLGHHAWLLLQIRAQYKIYREDNNTMNNFTNTIQIYYPPLELEK